VFSIIIPKYDDLVKKLNENKSINKENKEFIYPKIIKLKCIDSKELLLINEYNNIIKFKYKSNLDKHIIENKEMFQVQNISSEYSPSYTISSKDSPIVLYNNNKYMIKAGFWDGRIEMNSLVLDQKEKTYAKKNYYVKEGPVLLMEITKDEKILICGTKTGCLICFSIEKFSLNLIKKLYSHSDEITSININDNLNMFATSSLDGYINLHILPNFELVRSIKICNTNINSYNENDSEFYYANNVFLSSSPVACVTAFISSKRLFRSFTINGEFIEEIQETNNLNYIKCPIIFNDLDFQDYIIYGTDDGTIKIRKFPHLELINSICPKEGNEIISMDISKDNKYCYIWLNNNEIFVIKDLYVDSEKDKKRISKIDKEMEHVNEDSD
jgi:WD40 repeat protein